MNTYRFGIRFTKFRNLCMVVTLGIVFGFYFIYDLLFSEQSWWNPKAAAAGLLLFAVIVLVLVVLLFGKMKESTYYRLTKNAVEFSMFGRSAFYPYSDFKKAYYRLWGPFDTIPVTFELSDGRKFEFNQYIENLAPLTLGLLDHMGPGAELQEGLRDRIKALI